MNPEQTQWNLGKSRPASQRWVAVGVVGCMVLSAVPLMFKEVRHLLCRPPLARGRVQLGFLLDTPAGWTASRDDGGARSAAVLQRTPAYSVPVK